jgi:hypothetical protein
MAGGLQGFEGIAADRAGALFLNVFAGAGGDAALFGAVGALAACGGGELVLADGAGLLDGFALAVGLLAGG